MVRHPSQDSLFSLTVGPLVWATHFLTVYITTAIACAKGWYNAPALGITWMPLLVGVATLLAAGLILLGAWVAWRRWRGQPHGDWMPPHDTPDLASRRRFLAYAALLLCGASLIAVVWESLPVVFMDTCR